MRNTKSSGEQLELLSSSGCNSLFDERSQEDWQEVYGNTNQELFTTVLNRKASQNTQHKSDSTGGYGWCRFTETWQFRIGKIVGLEFGEENVWIHEHILSLSPCCWWYYNGVFLFGTYWTIYCQSSLIWMPQPSLYKMYLWLLLKLKFTERIVSVTSLSRLWMAHGTLCHYMTSNWFHGISLRWHNDIMCYMTHHNHLRLVSVNMPISSMNFSCLLRHLGSEVTKRVQLQQASHWHRPQSQRNDSNTLCIINCPVENIKSIRAADGF